MTCASCANRVERKLNKLDGVTATVNYATERATVHAPAGITADRLVEAVLAAGYTARVPAAAGSAPRTGVGMGFGVSGSVSGMVGATTVAADGASSAARARDTGPDGPTHDDTTYDGDGRDDAAPDDRLRRRLIGAAALSVPVVALAMLPVLRFPGWQWVSLALAGPVVGWAAWPFHRSAWLNARHGAATMDTLISVGTLSAFGWSLYALLFGTSGLFGTAGPSGGAGPLGSTGSTGMPDPTGHLYFEVAAGVTTFILAATSK